MRKSAQNDFDTIADRIIPFAVRGETREKLKLLAEEHRKKLSNLESLTDGKRLGCPVCKSSEHVRIVGNGRGNTKKFECKARHDPALTGRKKYRFRFTTYTSHEALQVYRDFMVEALSLLAMCEGTYDGIAKYLNVSKRMVEFGTAVLLDYLKEEGKGENIRVDGDTVVVYADFSTTRVTRAASMVFSRVGDTIVYQVACAMNYLTAWNFVRALKERLVLNASTRVIFVTDGEKAWVAPIRRFFPEAIHIRQFHSESSIGLVYVHLPHGGKLYTVRFPWDAVLEDGEPNEEALRMRKWRKLESKDRSEKTELDRTELFDGVIVWEGTVYEPRGTRRKIGATVSGAMGGRTGGENRESRAPVGDGVSGAVGAEISGFETLAEICDDRIGGDGDIAPRTDGARRIFKGSLEDAMRIPVVEHAYSVLSDVFGGLYVTSNAVECLFNVKSSLRYHRTVKKGDALIHVALCLKTQLRKKSREEIRDFLRGDVVTFERMRRVVVTGTKSSSLDRKEKARQIVLEAYEESRPVVICYQDGRKRRTSRMIEPLEMWDDPYTHMAKLRAYCYLRDAERTFLIDRIVDATPMDTDLSIIA